MNRLRALSKEDLIRVINFLMLHNLNTKRDLDMALNDLEHAKKYRAHRKRGKGF